MFSQTTVPNARANLKALLDHVTENREIVIINRRGAESVALVTTSELESLMETAYLLRSPKNARRLMAALNRAQGRKLAPQSVEKLRQEMGLEQKERAA
jgi:antitoxin YefM